ncbi:MAG: CheR family methyltransferase [Desulfuromonadales bacterium]
MKRVLQVGIVGEDSLRNRLLASLVATAGHQTTILAHPRMETIRDQHLDVLLLDLSDAEAKGEELFRRLVRQRLTGRTPVIVFSQRFELEYELLDAYDFLSPTADPQRLLEDLALLAAGPAAEEAYSPLTPEAAESFQSFLAEHAGLHFDQRNLRLLERGLHRRMRAVRSPDYPAYFRYLEQNFATRGELQKLLSLLTVGETYFFRYRSDREALLHYVLPELIRRRKAERRLSIWSAGCSTGEEPYSIAILLLEHFPQLSDWRIDILATDINKRSLNQARQGVYRRHALRCAAGPYIDRYFTPLQDDRYQLDSRVRDLVRFAYYNLQASEPPQMTDGGPPDVIFCRNVLIYFRRATFCQIIARFQQYLPEGGYLFLGHAENLAGMSDLFQPVHEHGAFFYRSVAPDEKSKPPRIATALEPPGSGSSGKIPDPPPGPVIRKTAASPALPGLPPQARTVPDTAVLLDRARQAFDREDFAEAESLFTEVLRFRPENLEAITGQGLILANQGRYAAAREFCARALRLDDLYPNAYLLSGLTYDMEGDLERAAAEYQRVLWLKMDFIAAHYFLARVHGRQGKSTEAARDFRNVLRHLEKLPAETIVPHSGGLSREVFLEVCREDLAKLTPAP